MFVFIIEGKSSGEVGYGNVYLDISIDCSSLGVLSKKKLKISD